MKAHRTKRHALALLCAAALLGAAPGRADTLRDILSASEASTAAAQASQQRIDQLADETRALVQEYKSVMKQVDGLKVYNARLEKQIANQEQRVAAIDGSIAEVTVIQRQITPLLVRMIDGLEEFIALDKPFHLGERRQRVAFLRDSLDRTELGVAEKFRRVMEAYRIEIEYGRKIDTYTDRIPVDGVEREVNILRIGRIALLYQAPDLSVSGHWNPQTRAWEELDDSAYRSSIRDGIRMAGKQASIGLLTLPVAAPEKK